MGLALLLGISPVAALDAATNGAVAPGEIPPLRPPKPEMLPGFWEQHGVWVGLIGGAVLLAVILAFRILLRPKPPILLPPATVARQALAAWRQRVEDAALLAEVSATLRHYLIDAFHLPKEEFTNHELSQRLEALPAISPEVATAAGELLARMEDRRFNTATKPHDSTTVPGIPLLNPSGSPQILEGSVSGVSEAGADTTPSPTGHPSHASTVEQALKLIDEVERHLHPATTESATSQRGA